MRKVIIYSIVLVFVSISIYNSIIGYFADNIYLGHNAAFPEVIYHEYYANKLIGVSGTVRNDTILPIMIERIEPIGGRGIKYFTTVISTWGVSETTREEIAELEPLLGKRIPPFSRQDIAVVYEFSDEFFVNPEGYKITYTILGIRFNRVIIR